MLVIRPDAAQRVTVFGIHPEQGGYFPGGEQPLIVAVHVPISSYRSEYDPSLATNGYFLPRFREISSAI